MDLSGGLVLGLALIFIGGFFWVRRARRDGQKWIVVDGSNVLYWERETPNLRTLLWVIEALKGEGYAPVVWFDANAGYLISDRYMGPVPLAKALGLSPRQVFVASKGQPADPLLLEGARKLGAKVVTNDRFRDWAERFPEVETPGFLVRGYVGKDEVGLDWGEG